MRTWEEIRAEIIANREAEIEPYDGSINDAYGVEQEERLKKSVEDVKRTKMILKK